MRIISWNCCGAFRNKAEVILALRPDVLVIQECESLDRLKAETFELPPTSMEWHSCNGGKKGLAIFAFGEYRLTAPTEYCTNFEIVVPVVVKKGRKRFNLLAAWTLDNKQPGGRYVEQISRAVDHYSEFVALKKTILIGDFNSNTIFDRRGREHTHSGLVAKLKGKNIVSAYHLAHVQEQGLEFHPTFYLYRHQDKPFHLDHCFLSKDLAGKLEHVEIGSFKDWSEYSDHAPLVIDLKQ